MVWRSGGHLSRWFNCSPLAPRRKSSLLLLRARGRFRQPGVAGRPVELCSWLLAALAGRRRRGGSIPPVGHCRSWDDLCLNSPTARAPRNGASGPGRGDFKHPHRPLRGPRPIAPTLGFASPALGLSGAPPFLGVSPRGCLPRVSGWPAVAPPAGPAYWYTGPRLGPDGRLPSRGGNFFPLPELKRPMRRPWLCQRCRLGVGAFKFRQGQENAPPPGSR